jgi:hypothetical protein
MTESSSAVSDKREISLVEIRCVLEHVAEAAIAGIEGEKRGALEALHRGLPALLTNTIQVAVNVWAAVLRISFDERPPAELSTAVPPLARSTLESLISLLFIFESPTDRLNWFYRAGWRAAVAELRDRESRFGHDPDWAAHLNEHRRWVDAHEADLGITDEERKDPDSATNAWGKGNKGYWPNPGRMIGTIANGTPRRRFLDLLAARFYGRLSADSHLSYLGLAARGGVLHGYHAGEVREDNRSKQLLTALTVHIAFLSEVVATVGLSEQACRMREVWKHVAPHLPAKELWDSRYDALLVGVPRVSAPKSRDLDPDCVYAEEFLEKLSPLHPFWRDSPGRWVFRGLDDVKHKLIAKADRAGAYKQYGVLKGVLDFAKRDDAMQTLLNRFRESLDRAGMAIPALAPAAPARTGTTQHSWIEHTELPLMALAQHLGLPTQLLDWSLQARNAAYFAAEPATRNTYKCGRLGVWALRRELGDDLTVATGAWERTQQQTSATLTFETAPRATNPNLHAQSGLFTRLHGEKAHSLCLENYIQLVAEQYAPSALACAEPYLRRLTAPQSSASRLLRLLSYEGVEGASMFPGNEGVVRSMQERGRWDEPPQGKS